MTEQHLPQPDSHDLHLPAWGPYGNKYNGLSHIPDIARGLRFDVSIFPAYYRHRVTVPNMQWESGYHPWDAAPGLNFFSYRYDLEWKDRVYCDVACFAIPGDADDNARVVRCEFVNNTDLVQHQALHYFAYLNFPPVRPYSHEAILPSIAQLPEGAIWMDALDYAHLQYAAPRPSDNLVYEGWYRGEVRGHGFVNGTGIGCDFGKDGGDLVRYKFSIPKAMGNGLLLARYRAPKGDVEFELRGITGGFAKFSARQDFGLCAMPLGAKCPGEYYLELVSLGGAPLELDGFVLLEAEEQNEVSFTQHQWNSVPQIEQGPRENSLLLQYADLQSVYGLAWSGEGSVVRQFFTSELDRTLRYFVNEHVYTELHGDERGHFTNVFIRPIILQPHSSTVLNGIVCNGNAEAVREKLAAFDSQSNSLEEKYVQAKQTRVTFNTNPSGEKYLFSQERFAATLLTNVAYPIYTRRRFIRHFTPGKWWDCLYTWDSGFISLGLQSIDLARSIDCLNAYTTPPGDTQAAFLHHGSPVPTQIYAFQELWNRTRSQALLKYFYPRLRQYYLFLAGRLGSSTTRHLKSSLLKTWDYFYNSAGWDDYPAQLYVHAHELEATVTPVVTTAHAIRSAKILQLAARALGWDADVRDYQNDIDTWVRALNTYSWADDAGIFSYVIHDDGGYPCDILREAQGQNLNLGFDGISPFFAGICNREQERRLFARIESDAHFWTPVGLTAVDQSAPYYRTDGYWNGAVWFAYQWFIWKALLDTGYGDMAFRIARTALDIWQDEVAATYHCFEHFVVASRRGAGWHQFGGLSAPLLAWFNAYHCPGTLTCGLDAWIENLQISPDYDSLQAKLYHAPDDRTWLALAVLNPDRKYSVAWNGKNIAPTTRYPGTLEIPLRGAGTLTIRPYV